MFCPSCSTRTRVLKVFRDPDETHRLRECPKCHSRQLTLESQLTLPAPALRHYLANLYSSDITKAKARHAKD